MTDRALLARAKADPEAFRRETVEALQAEGLGFRAAAVRHCSPNDIITALKAPWFMRDQCSAKAHNDALLQALTEMTPADREKLGW